MGQANGEAPGLGQQTYRTIPPIARLRTPEGTWMNIAKYSTKLRKVSLCELCKWNYLSIFGTDTKEDLHLTPALEDWL
jgi:hypothetical protein